MSIFRKILTVLIIFLAIIVFIFVAGVFIWQYYESKSEISKFKNEIIKYEEFYLKDRKKLKDKSEDELRKMIKKVEGELEQISPYLPQKGYLTLYNHIDFIKTHYQNYKVTIIFDSIEPISKDFYEILNVIAYAKGSKVNILEATQEIKNSIKLIDFISFCSVDESANKDTLVKINFNLYLFIESLRGVKKYRKADNNPSGEAYKTWLPPFSYKVRRYYERVSKLRKLEISMSDQKRKLELYAENNKKRDLLRKSEIVLEHLEKLGKDDSRYLSFPIKIEKCEGL